jgi:hypothetical protein
MKLTLDNGFKQTFNLIIGSNLLTTAKIFKLLKYIHKDSYQCLLQNINQNSSSMHILDEEKGKMIVSDFAITQDKRKFFSLAVNSNNNDYEATLKMFAIYRSDISNIEDNSSLPLAEFSCNSSTKRNSDKTKVNFALTKKDNNIFLETTENEISVLHSVDLNSIFDTNQSNELEIR